MRVGGLTSSGEEELKSIESDEHPRCVPFGDGDSHKDNGSSERRDWKSDGRGTTRQFPFST